MRPSSCPAVVQLTLLPHCTNSAVQSAAGGTQTDTDRHRQTQRCSWAWNGSQHNEKLRSSNWYEEFCSCNCTAERHSLSLLTVCTMTLSLVTHVAPTRCSTQSQHPQGVCQLSSSFVQDEPQCSSHNHGILQQWPKHGAYTNSVHLLPSELMIRGHTKQNFRHKTF